MKRVSGTFLGFFWLFLEPLMFMLMYVFLVKFVFGNSTPNFHLFIFLGLTTWAFISSSILNSTVSIARNKAIFEQVYFHKFVYPTIEVIVSSYVFLISNLLIFILILFSNVTLTPHFFAFPLIMIIMFTFTLGVCLIASHIGVYFFDLWNILNFILRLAFYITPIMWSYDFINNPYVNLLKMNPASVIMESYRNIIMYGKSPNYLSLFILFLFSLVLIRLGCNLITKYEGEYGRVI